VSQECRGHAGKRDAASATALRDTALRSDQRHLPSQPEAEDDRRGEPQEDAARRADQVRAPDQLDQRGGGAAHLAARCCPGAGRSVLLCNLAGVQATASGPTRPRPRCGRAGPSAPRSAVGWRRSWRWPARAPPPSRRPPNTLTFSCVRRTLLPVTHLTYTYTFDECLFVLALSIQKVTIVRVEAAVRVLFAVFAPPMPGAGAGPAQVPLSPCRHSLGGGWASPRGGAGSPRVTRPTTGPSRSPFAKPTASGSFAALSSDSSSSSDSDSQ